MRLTGGRGRKEEAAEGERRGRRRLRRPARHRTCYKYYVLLYVLYILYSLYVLYCVREHVRYRRGVEHAPDGSQLLKCKTGTCRSTGAGSDAFIVRRREKGRDLRSACAAVSSVYITLRFHSHDCEFLTHSFTPACRQQITVLKTKNAFALVRLKVAQSLDGGGTEREAGRRQEPEPTANSRTHHVCACVYPSCVYP